MNEGESMTEPVVTEVEVGGVKMLQIVVDAVPLPASLTPAEREVVELILEGLSSKEIAARRGTAARTVANQLARVFEKMGVNSRGELIAALS